MPPAYSAKMIKGVRAYELARRADGAHIELTAVEVTVSELELVAFEPDRATLSMTVSAGFYVRSLAHDLGVALGMGATLQSLRRTRSGSFGLDQAVTAEALVTSDRAAVLARMIPLGRLLPAVPSTTLTADDAVRARRGIDLPAPWAAAPALSRLLDERGELIALAIPAKRPGFLHPSVVLG
jgi:tRNA pseudouridine55 synthase